MPKALPLGVELEKSVTTPAVVMRPIVVKDPPLVNHSAPSGPAVMSEGMPMAPAPENSVIAPAVVMRPILLLSASVNHSAPSGPAVMS